MTLLINKSPRAATVTLIVAEKFIIIFVMLASLGATSKIATLYDEDGSNLTLFGRNSPDLTLENFDNKAKSINAQGTWILYADVNYAGAFQLISNTFEEVEHHLQGETSSIRFVGSSDNSDANIITVFEDINFQGAEFHTEKDIITYGKIVKSLIVTGSEPWTIFETNNFGGDSLCIYPSDMYDLYDIGIPNNIIGSVRLGCIE